MAEYLECSEETALRRLRKAERNICVQMDDRGMGKAFSENSEIVIHRALELMEERTVLSEEKAEWLYNEIIEREDIF